MIWDYPENKKLLTQIKTCTRHISGFQEWMADRLRGAGFPCFNSHEIKAYIAEKVKE